MAEVGEDFPQLCETCLGPNPYVRMIKLPPGHKLCKISNLPFQAFRWKPSGGRQKETIVSFVVAKERNICQTCLNDMQYGLPVGVRDKLLEQLGQSNALALAAAPTGGVGAAYHYHQLESGSSSSSSSTANSSSTALVTQGFAQQAASSAAERQLAVFAQARAAIEARSSTAFRNLPKLCSFWVAGTCTRCVKKLCQFRPCAGETSFAFPEIARSHKDLHRALVDRLKEEGATEVMKTLDEPTRKALREAGMGYNHDTAIQDRVAGKDELSDAYLGAYKKKESKSALNPPEDKSITTLWIGNVENDITEAAFTQALYPGGVFSGFHMVPKSRCAFVEYTTRSAAEEAARNLANNMSINGRSLSINWAKPKAKVPPPPPPLAAEGAQGAGAEGSGKVKAKAKAKRSSIADGEASAAENASKKVRKG